MLVSKANIHFGENSKYHLFTFFSVGEKLKTFLGIEDGSEELKEKERLTQTRQMRRRYLILK